MATILTQPQVITNTVNTVQVTSVVNNAEEQRVEVHYITMLEDGTPYQRGYVTIDGYDAVKAMYTELDAKIADGRTFEEASAEILYARVLANLVG